MAGTADERLIVMLEARISEFEKRMKKAEATGTRSFQNLRRGSQGATRQMEADMMRGTARINQALATTSTRIGAFAGGIVGGVLATAVGSLTTNLRQTVTQIANVGDEAKRAGVNARAFQELAFAAQANRVGVDALTDGLKELNLRADEWIVTGGGPAAEAFQRLGYDARDLARRLEKPDELFLDIIGRLEDLDDAARIRIADEIFGGTGGERFVQLIGQGEAGLRQLMARAHEVGAVLDEEMIERASDLDRRWEEVTTRMGGWLKSLAVVAGESAAGIGMIFTDLVDYLGGLTDSQTDAEALLRQYPALYRLIGEEAAEAMAEVTVSEDQVRSVRDLTSELEVLKGEVDSLVPALRAAAREAEFFEQDAEADRLREIADNLEVMVTAADNGNMSMEAFSDGVAAATGNATRLIAELDRIDRADFDHAIAGLGAVQTALGNVVAAAAAAAAQLAIVRAAATEDPREGTGNAANYNAGLQTATPQAPRTAPSPPARPGDIDFGYAGPPADTGGGGGAARTNAFDEALSSLRDEIAALQQETAAYEAVVGSSLPNALDYARKRAELLTAAQEEGRTVTPELAAEIDRLALSYAEAGHAAEEAADRLERVQDDAARGADAIADLFMAALDGADSAREAVRNLLLEIARAQIGKLMQMLAGGGTTGFGKVAAGLGNLTSFDGGGYTGNGPRSGGLDGRGGQLAMLHPRETIIDHTRGQAGGRAAAPQVNVYNQAGHVVDAGATVTGTPDLGYMIEVVVNEKLARGRFDRTMGAAFGARRTKAVRA